MNLLLHRFPLWALLVVGTLVLATAVPSALAADPNKPHPHRGILKPVTSAPAAVPLSAADTAKLQAGDLVQRHQEKDGGGSGVAVQYIKASPQTIWETILAYDRYTDWVNNVESCTVYRKDGHDLYVDMQNSVWGFGFGFYTKNTVRKDLGYMSWVLDYDRESDVSDMVGYWRVEAVSSQPPVTKLEYSTQIHMSGVPGFIVRYLTKDALSEGTGWVKEHSEAAQRAN